MRRGHESVNRENTPQFLVVGNGRGARRIAYLRRAPKPGTRRPGIVWLGGFRSDMHSIKAAHLDCYARESGCAYVRFDYSGHGLSEGCFEAGTIGAWLEESLTAVRALTDGPQILAGSSMGGWLALLAARALHESGEAERLKGLVLIAPAVDFTESLIFARMPPTSRAELAKTGVWLRASAYAPEPYPITRELIEEGRKHLLLGGVIRTHCPVHILQGMQDEHVPWRHATELAEHLFADPVSLTLVKDGDHRLSREEDLTRLSAAVDTIGS
ncbi:MAG TPA: alpha/beta hydrolase [Methylocella sp.]|jgi:pimeloyl-ACP methyl ester carboxylesterase